MTERICVESVETFSNGAGTRVTLHLRKARFLSDKSIPLDRLPLPLQEALLEWLDPTDERTDR